MFFKRLSLIIPFLLSLSVKAQILDTLSQDIPTDILEDLAEQAESEDGEFDNNTFLEDLEWLTIHKINLNNTTVEELMKTTVLTELQAISILNYIRTYGDFYSIYELKGVLGLDIATIEKLLPFVLVADPDSRIYSFKDELTKGKHTIMYRTQFNVEKARGYTPSELYQGRMTSRYAGDRTRQYLRYRYQFWKGISYGITLEKDPGELLFNKNLKLRIDYVSAHLFLEHKGNFRFIALGDFEVNLGQGLTMWQGFGVGKSTSVNSMKRTADVLKPHTSVIEDNFNRGAGATFQKKGFEITGFASYRKRDGSSIAIDTLTNDVLEVQSLQTSGLHRTESELKNRAGIALFASGGRIGWSNRLFSVYFNSTYHRLGSALTPPSDLYRAYSFSGKSLYNASIDYTYLGKKFMFFGESAVSDNGGYALLHGISARPSPGVTLSIVHRLYAKNYQTLAGSAFGETTNTNPSNEHGLYAGISFRINPKIRINNYIDIYHFSWMKYRVDKPNTNGYDIFHEWNFRLSRKFEFYTRFRYKSRARNITRTTEAITDVRNYRKSSLRFNYSYKASSSWTFKGRGEWSFFNDGLNSLKKGYVFYQDIGYKIPSGKLTLQARYVVFNVDDYDARIYAYENDVLYAFSIPAYLGKGSRAYLMAKVKLHRRLDLWLRYAQTFRSDLEVVGSGLEEMPGNTRSEIKVQLRARF